MSLNTVKTEITVDGNLCDFEYMDLDQSVSNHHKFEIVVSYRHEKKSVWAITVDEIFRTTLNKSVFIKMTHIASGDVNEFEGVVTDIKAVGLDGDKGTIILCGGSPTLLLDRDPSMNSFVDYTLYNVVSETLDNTGIKVNIDNRPQLQQQIPYIARYRETSFAFLSRVLSSYGEWFYYDGKKLVIGRPTEQSGIKVKFDVELSEVHSTVRMQNLNTQYYDYDPTTNNHFVEESATITNTNLHMKVAKHISDSLYPNPSMLPVGRSILSEGDMTNTVRVKQSREYTKMSVFKARCKTCAIRIGEIAVVTLPELEDVFFKDLGEFLVTEVRHRVNKEGHYENTFTGIAGVTETLPDDHIVTPQAFQETAIVVANDDPKNQGRIKVRFFWQSGTECSNWIRVQSPDAGKSGVVDKNRGFVFIPEIGDQVMVGYLDGDPSCPYVMGSLFHRDNSSGATEKNTVRSIVTRGGSLLRFTDSEDDNTYKIELQYNETNGIVLTVKENEETMTIQTSKDIFIKAPELIQMEAKKIVLLAEETIQAKAEDKIEMVAKKAVHIESSDNMEFMAKTIFSESSQEYSIKGKNINAKSDTSMIFDGGDKLDIKTDKIKMN